MAFCSQCGNQLPDTAAFCSKCGSPTKKASAHSSAGGADNGGGAPAGGIPAGGIPAGGIPAGGIPAGGNGKAVGKKGPVIILAVLGVIVVVLIGVLIGIAWPSSSSSSSEEPSKWDPFNKVPVSFEEALEKGQKSLEKGDSSEAQLQLVSSDVESYPTVKLYYNVQDNGGTPVIMTSPNAYIRETISGGAEIERKVKSVSRLSGNQGVGFDILIDKSGSMEEDFYIMQNVLRDFINSLEYDSGDHAELIAFDSLIMYMCTYTNDRNRLLNGIDNMSTSGMTALYDALITGIENAGNRAGANCVIAFTDGADNESYNSYYDVITLAQQKEVPVYLIGTYDAEADILRNIASQTGGRYWNVASIDDVGDILDSIHRLQKDMYCVEYISDETADAYSSRSVSCIVLDDYYYSYEERASFKAVETIKVQPHSSRYEVIAADITWTEANNECIRRGGHLATITSQDEMNKVSTLAENSGLKYIWIGGYTSVRNGRAYGHWITGESFNFQAWYPGEPSRNDHDGTPEAYLMLWRVQGVWSWNDQRNDLFSTGLSYFGGNIGYICEYES